MTKYKLTDKTKEFYGLTLHQIVAVTQFGNVHVGDLGGWIEKESNLSQKGDCWISGDARITGNARISGDAQIKSFHDICIMSCFGSEGRTTTAFNCKDKTIKVNCGCFNGTINEFEERIEQTHGNTQYGREYKTMVELIKIHLSD